MKPMDSRGLLLCDLMAEAFELSYDRYDCSSEVFIRRFMNSKIAKLFDLRSLLDQPFTEVDVLDYLDEEYGITSYGKVKYSKDELYWIGYIYMYASYTSVYSLKMLYNSIKPKELREVYLPYHTLDCSLAIDRIFECKNIPRNEEEMTKKGVEILRQIRGYDRIHRMKLRPKYFNLIKNGTKTIEMRINDEKRSKIKVGHTIVFTNIETNEEISVNVVGLEIYNDFYELYEHYDKISIGYLENEVADARDMYEYYSKEDIARYGALAIKISLCEE